MKKNILITALLIVVVLFINSCDRKNGELVTGMDLPLDFELPLYSENIGIYPDTSILEDPKNPYSGANISMETVWDFYDESPSAKASFYLWGTMLANIPTGEHQYFTAKSLHELYTVGGSTNAKMQAKKAYRSILDHFFNSVTWWEAEWLNNGTYYAVILKDLVGESLYDPSDMNLLPLYNDPAEALADMSEWGYVYDIETKTVYKWE